MKTSIVVHTLQISLLIQWTLGLFPIWRLGCSAIKTT
jgi:hypothetical protein